MNKTLAYTFVFLVTSPSMSMACLWEGGENSYWPTNTIKVCFTNSNESERHIETAKVVEASLEELDQLTRFRFYGYSECVDHERDEHQIRISLDDRGSSSRDYELGPGSGLLWPSTFLPLIAHRDSRPVSESFVNWTAKHEIIHLLGVHHDVKRSSNAYENLSINNSNLVTFGDYDPDSIMLNNDALSEGDLRCLNMLAFRKMHLVYNGTQTTTYSDFETTVDTSFEETYIQNESPAAVE